jgi:hypothetical protein
MVARTLLGLRRRIFFGRFWRERERITRRRRDFAEKRKKGLEGQPRRILRLRGPARTKKPATSLKDDCAVAGGRKADPSRANSPSRLPSKIGASPGKCP